MHGETKDKSSENLLFHLIEEVDRLISKKKLTKYQRKQLNVLLEYFEEVK